MSPTVSELRFEVTNIKDDLKELKSVLETDIKDLANVITSFTETIVGLSHDTDHTEESLKEIKEGVEKTRDRLEEIIIRLVKLEIESNLNKDAKEKKAVKQNQQPIKEDCKIAEAKTKLEHEKQRSGMISIIKDVIKYILAILIGGGASKLL